MISRRKGLLVVGCIMLLCIIPLVALGLYSNAMVGEYFSGPRVGYPISTAVDEALKPYINVTITGGSGYSGNGTDRMFLNGTVSWINLPQDSVKSLQNIHLVMYTRVDEKNYNATGTLIAQYIGSHVETYPSEPTLPTDAIDHVEVIIPVLGIDTPQYKFSLNCSTKV